MDALSVLAALVLVRMIVALRRLALLAASYDWLAYGLLTMAVFETFLHGARKLRRGVTEQLYGRRRR